MGKTEQGAVWLNAAMLSAYDYYQWWRNNDDAIIGTLLRRFTILPMEEIDRLEKLEGADINEAKKILAFEATKLCHGEQAAIEAQDTAQKVFEQGGIGDDLPSIEVAKSCLNDGIPLLDLLVESGLCSSKGEARRLIQGGGARINDEPVASAELLLSNANLTEENYIKLSAGKKKHIIIRINS